MRKNLLITLLLLWCVLGAVAQHKPVQATRPPQLRFTENKGQWDSRILYRTTVPNGNLIIEKNAFYYFLYQGNDIAQIHHPGGKDVLIHGHAFKAEFVGAGNNVKLNGATPYTDYANYYLGNNPKYWASNVKIYGQVNYTELYNGINMLLYTRNDNQLKYDFIVQPNADISQIKIRYTGADDVALLKNGTLQIKTSVGNLMEQKPYAYQDINGVKTEVPCKFTLVNGIVQFEFEKGYNSAYTLVIDPNIIFSTYTGATADNWGYTATYDNQGNMYLGGYVNATPFNIGPAPTYPTTTGAFQVTWHGGTGGNNGTGNGIAYACDMGITKFTANGSALIYSTYIGGSDNETPHSLVVDANDNLIIYGVSYSSDYPVSANAFDATYNGGGDIIVTKLNAAGSALVGSTFMGGSGDDGINFDPEEFTPGNLKRNYGDQNRGEVNIDATGNIYIASCTKSSNFPVSAGAIQSTLRGGQDGCAFKLNSDCSQRIWGTYLGGTNDDACYSLDIGPNGTLYVAGGTMSNNFPTTAGTIHPSYMGGTTDGFVALINTSGTQLTASSYIGTAGDDQVFFVKLDAPGNVYFIGQSTGSYPVFNATYSNPNSGQFISKLNPALTTVVYSTVFGNGNGRPNISPTAFLVDTCENVYVAGWGAAQNSIFTQSGFAANIMTNMPLTADAYQRTTDGTDFYFIAIAKNAQTLLYGTYFGGSGINGNGEEHVDGGTSRFDKRGVIYEAMCAGCGGTSLTPTTAGSWSPTNRSSNCNELGLKMEFNLSGTHVQIDASPRVTGCVPLNVQFQALTNNVQSITWYFGDGTISNQFNPLHTYNDTGTYHIFLVGIDSNSCNIVDTAYLDVWVRDDSINANFAPGIEIDCDSNKVELSAHNYSTSSYHWNMGDGQIYTIDSVTHIYQNSGSYNVQLIVTDTTKCNLRDTFTTPIFIPRTIDATFSLSDTAGCRPLSVNFNAPAIGTQNYFWNFGDTATSTNNPASHIYNNGGNYTVSLIITDTTTCNKADTAYANIVVIDSAANAEFNFRRTFYGCDSVDVTLWANYTGADFQSWDFGDGTSASNLDTVTHRYTVAGTYTITHYLTDFDKICRPIDTAQIAISLMPLDVTITIPDTGGCVPFTANFTGNTGLLSTNYTWYYGDGASDTGKIVSHTYNAVGTYNVVVLGLDTNACIQADSAFAQITVIDDRVTAAFDLNVLNDCDSNLVIDLVDQSTNAVEYYWNFGDSSTSTTPNENHTYTLPNTYYVTLVVVDTNRCHPIDSITKPVTLLPNTYIDFTVDDVCMGTPAQFNNLSNSGAQFHWSFADGTSSTQYSPSHLYTQANTYNVTLTMVDTTTCNVYDTVTHPVIVHVQPRAGFSMVNDTFKFETPVNFYSTSFFYDYLHWDFGDGTTIDNEITPTHTYETINWHTICLTASNDVCADTECKDIFISFTGLIGVPNAFSPNGDGVNDKVYIEGKGIVELTFRIYNRWGEKVFETNDKTVGWDGTYKGVLQEMDTYTYSVDAKLINGQYIPLKGNITLLR